MMSPLLADLPPGFASPSPATHAVFRLALDALSRPGRIYPLPGAPTVLLQPPTGLSRAMAGLLLTLLDGETSVWLSARLDTPLVRAWIEFHTGVALAERPEEAAFVALHAAELDAGMWRRIGRGCDELPQNGATALVEVESLADRGPLVLRGPGIAASASLATGGIVPEVWQRRAEEARAYPMGIDLLLCCGDCLAGLPRSTRVSLEG